MTKTLVGSTARQYHFQSKIEPRHVSSGCARPYVLGIDVRKMYRVLCSVPSSSLCRPAGVKSSLPSGLYDRRRKNVVFVSSTKSRWTRGRACSTLAAPLPSGVAGSRPGASAASCSTSMGEGKHAEAILARVPVQLCCPVPHHRRSMHQSVRGVVAERGGGGSLLTRCATLHPLTKRWAFSSFS